MINFLICFLHPNSKAISAFCNRIAMEKRNLVRADAGMWTKSVCVHILIEGI